MNCWSHYPLYNKFVGHLYVFLVTGEGDLLTLHVSFVTESHHVVGETFTVQWLRVPASAEIFNDRIFTAAPEFKNP